jgi:hypothetical protein
MKKSKSLIAVAILLFVFSLPIFGAVVFSFLKKDYFGSFITACAGAYMVSSSFALPKLQPRARRVALAFFSMFMTVFGLVFVWRLSIRGDVTWDLDISHFQIPDFMARLICLFIFFVSAWSLWILMRRDVRELFQNQNNSPKPISI